VLHAAEDAGWHGEAARKLRLMSSSGRRDNRRRAARGLEGFRAWCLYDWANSAFPGGHRLFYLLAKVAVDRSRHRDRHSGPCGGLIAILSPVGAIADGRGSAAWILVQSICVAATASLWFMRPASLRDDGAGLSYRNIGFVGIATTIHFCRNWLARNGSAAWRLGGHQLRRPQCLIRASSSSCGRSASPAWMRRPKGHVRAVALCAAWMLLPLPSFVPDVRRSRNPCLQCRGTVVL
jgi:hypothetical protein